MHIFQSPGLADPNVNDAALTSWNAQIRSLVDGHRVSPFLVLDPRDIKDGDIANSVKWPGNPREPLDCLGEDLATKLSDWGWPGRAELHNEYLEYTLVMRPDANGKLRPKRFVATTELMEWWLTMAVFDLEYFLLTIKNITGHAYTAADLFLLQPDQWAALPVQARAEVFHRRLVGLGRTQPPEHPLNIEHVLFMSENINGLNDLIFVVHFGSFPYAVTENSSRRRARIEEIFLSVNRPDLFCRNADPGAAQGAYDQAFIPGSTPPQGKALAFADPLGMYMRGLTTTDLRIAGAPVPNDWVRFSRGVDTMHMRLEFGPDDDDPRFLDEVVAGTGDAAPPISGYFLAREIEVGPRVVIGRTPRAITAAEFEDIPAVTAQDAITCGLPGNARCRMISDFADLFENPLGIVPGTRGQRDG
ncbi:hypothetical protein [Antarctobacter sp.]|uniref:hypothetical protein n=1 Tax=Antarctobacter sp. TaxID=1872577 RepID=UPI003A950D46